MSVSLNAVADFYRRVAQVIPGGSEEFDAFIRQNLRTHRPDVFLGILQSAFILGESHTSCFELFLQHDTSYD